MPERRRRRGVRIGPHFSSSMLVRFGLYGSTALILRWRRSRPMVPVLTATRPVPHRSSLRHVLFAGWLQGDSTAGIAALDYASSCSSLSSLSLCLLSCPLRRPQRRGAHRGGHRRVLTSSPPCAFSRVISAPRVAAAPQQQRPQTRSIAPPEDDEDDEADPEEVEADEADVEEDKRRTRRRGENDS